MSPKRHLLSRTARTVLDELGIDLYYVDGGLVYMGSAEGSPYTPASMEAVEEACAAVDAAASLQDEAHRFEVFLTCLDSERGLGIDAPADDSLRQTLRSLGAPPPDAALSDRTWELSQWEQILNELRPQGSNGQRGSGSGRHPR